MRGTVIRVYSFYLNGFRQMTLGKTLWKIIIIKLVVIFTVLKFLFFPDYLNTHFTTDDQKSAYVLDQITGRDKVPGEQKGEW